MEAPRSRRLASWPLYLMGALFALGVLGVAAWNVELPYVAFSAGPVADAVDTIQVEEVEVFPPDGELLMLTVLNQDVNVYEALIAGLDPTIDLVRKEAIRRPGETDEEYRNRVLQQMDDSNFRAVAVALRILGYDMVPTEVVINEFLEGVPAADVLELGDTIVSVEGVSVGTVSDILDVLEGKSPGETVGMVVLRSGEEVAVEFELAEREDEPGRAMIGVVLGELTEPPFPVTIESGDVGGPSAGMMHTLAIIDLLTEEDLTKGHVIAGTGTIRPDGTVGNIGGIRQKVVAAEAAGASHILVPEGNYQTALTAERHDIVIVPVATIEDALEFFESLEPA